MPHDPGVGEVGLVAGEDVEVGPAHAHAPDAQQHLAGLALRLGTMVDGKGARGFAEDGQHGVRR